MVCSVNINLYTGSSSFSDSVFIPAAAAAAAVWLSSEVWLCLQCKDKKTDFLSVWKLFFLCLFHRRIPWFLSTVHVSTLAEPWLEDHTYIQYCAKVLGHH